MRMLRQSGVFECADREDNAPFVYLGLESVPIVLVGDFNFFEDD